MKFTLLYKLNYTLPAKCTDVFPDDLNSRLKRKYDPSFYVVKRLRDESNSHPVYDFTKFLPLHLNVKAIAYEV